jgi:hypothetical protein
MAEKRGSENPAEKSEDKNREQANQAQIRVRVDERNMRTCYANGFRTNTTPEEVVLDFGLNLVSPLPGPQNQPEMLFDVNERIVLNYASAKRLAIALSQVIRRHEEQFGEVEVDAAKRSKS